MDAQRKYRFGASNSFGLDAAEDLAGNLGYKAMRKTSLAVAVLTLKGPPNADLTRLDEQIRALGGTPSNVEGK